MKPSSQDIGYRAEKIQICSKVILMVAILFQAKIMEKQ